MIKEWNFYLNAFNQVPILSDLHIGGGTPTFFSAENLGVLLGQIISDSEINPNASFSFEAHPGSTTSAHLEVLRKLGFNRLSLGIQDFDTRVMTLINRRQSTSQVQAITNLARINGYTSINFDLIYGLPGQTKSTISKTIDIVTQIRPDRIALYGYAHVPKMKPAQLSFEHLLPGPEQRQELCELSKELLTDAGYREIGLDHYALPGDELLTASVENKLHRNFMGYTVQSSPMLIGLGPSAISDTGTMMAQNPVKLESWSNDIDNGEWVPARSHKMNEHDLILRRHILNIMCGFKTNWSGDIDACGFLSTVYERLLPYEHAGLISLTRTTLTVLPQGKPYIRHISMCFDERYHNADRSSIILSNAS
jgi:oxygen-independent coproporphyrinogen-3 oxidase